MSAQYVIQNKVRINYIWRKAVFCLDRRVQQTEAEAGLSPGPNMDTQLVTNVKINCEKCAENRGSSANIINKIGPVEEHKMCGTTEAIL